jgi:hypothetical protein
MGGLQEPQNPVRPELVEGLSFLSEGSTISQEKAVLRQAQDERKWAKKSRAA